MAITKGIYICANEPTEPSADMFLEPGSFTSNNEQCFEIQYVKDTRKLFYNTFGDDSYEVYNYATKTWTNNAYKTIDLYSSNTGNDWFFANYTKQKLSIDLTTLPGWANLSAGNHTIKIKAKGTGYKESELSSGVTVTKGASQFVAGFTGLSNSSGALTLTDDIAGTAIYTTATSGNNVTVTSDLDNVFPYNALEEVTDSESNVFIKIPKMYIKWITASDGSLEGFQMLKQTS